MICPKRQEDGASSEVFNYPKDDFYMPSDNTCTYCGSLHPDIFIARLIAGDVELGTTHKDYKVYIVNASGEPFKQSYREGNLPFAGYDTPDWVTRDIDQAKFYFQHLSIDQMKKFIELLNANKIKFQGGLRFSPLPFFCKPLRRTQ